MLYLLLVACLLTAGTASQNLEAEESVQSAQVQDLEAEESVPQLQVYNLEDVHHHQDGHGHHKSRPHDIYLQNVRGYKGQSNVDRIVTELNNPDYIEPITVLDYRYLKTGGRDYTRGAGGQILILPKNVRTNQRKEFGNYDELLEFLRLKQLAEIEAHHKEMSHLAYEHRPQHYREHHIQVDGHHQYDHDGHRHHDHYDHHDYQQQNRASLYGYKRDAPQPEPTQQEVVA